VPVLLAREPSKDKDIGGREFLAATAFFRGAAFFGAAGFFLVFSIFFISTPDFEPQRAQRIKLLQENTKFNSYLSAASVV
jgi:hypothetical protein